jgi:6-phospho-beta-glucosidase
VLESPLDSESIHFSRHAGFAAGLARSVALRRSSPLQKRSRRRDRDGMREVPPLTRDYATLCVIGASSVGTPILIEEIARAQWQGSLPALRLRLFGRTGARLSRVVEHGRFRLSRLLQETPGAQDIVLEPCRELSAALAGADLVLCQVRPSGMAGRVLDEELSLALGLPADEGLGPSGLSCYLRGRSAMDALHESVHRYAGGAPYLQLTSPLGLVVARARRRYGLRCFGVCELPTTTIAKVCRTVAQTVGTTHLRVVHAGLNHQAWLHAFHDDAGRDRTQEVVRAIPSSEIVGIEPAVIRRLGAVPLPYLRLYYHTTAVVAAQRSSRETRGRHLARWAARAEAAYLAEPGPDHEALMAILAERRMDWYAEGVVPAIAAFLSSAPRTIPLNLPSAGALPGAPDDAIVELPCVVAAGVATPVPVPPLSAGPRELTRRLIAYEAAALALDDAPDDDALADVLALHPLVPSTELAGRLARAMRPMLAVTIVH